MVPLVIAATALALWLSPSAQAVPPASIEVGSEAPGFSLASSDGDTYRLADIKDRRNLVLVFFRGTW